jgi:hypothetical protein
MSINYGQIGVGVNNSVNQPYTIVTSAVTTAATGSSFMAYLVHRQPTQLRTPTLSDNFGNTYVAVGTTFDDASSWTLCRYLCVNGNGGAGHQVTATNIATGSGTITGTTSTTITDTSQSWTTNQWVNYTCWDSTRLSTAVVTSNTANTLTFSAIPGSANIGDSYQLGGMFGTLVMIEITGGLPSGLLDQYNQTGGFLGSPFRPGAITLGSEAVNSALLLSLYQTETFASISFAESTGFTILYSYGNATAYPTQAVFAIAYQIVAPGTYNPSWTGGGNTASMVTVESFLGQLINGAAIAWVK